MPSREENEERFREFGLAHVRTQHRVAGLPSGMMNDAARWIAEQEEEEKKAQAASTKEQLQIAREQKQIALRTEQIALRTEQFARTTEAVARRTILPAWIAAGAAIAALIVGVLAWLFPRI